MTNSKIDETQAYLSSMVTAYGLLRQSSRVSADVSRLNTEYAIQAAVDAAKAEAQADSLDKLCLGDDCNCRIKPRDVLHLLKAPGLSLDNNAEHGDTHAEPLAREWRVDYAKCDCDPNQYAIESYCKLMDERIADTQRSIDRLRRMKEGKWNEVVMEDLLAMIASIDTPIGRWGGRVSDRAFIKRMYRHI